MWHTQVLHGPSVSLVPLGPSFLETVRQWRNSEGVREHMVNQQYISPEAQHLWYESIQHNRSQCHYVIFYKDTSVGVANIKQTQGLALEAHGEAETGFFIGEIAHRGSMLAFFAAIVMNDYCFHQLKLATLRARVKPSNSAALRFNQQLGYLPCPRDDGEWQHFSLNVSQHQQAKQTFIRFFRDTP